MNMIIKILLGVWAVWCFLVFVILCLLIFPILFLAVLSRSAAIIRAAHYVPTRMARVLLFLFGVRPYIHGKENIDPKAQYIFISNHRSLLDAVIAGAVIPNYVKFLGKAEMRKWPVLGYLLNHFYVGVQREDKADREHSMAVMIEKMQTGCSFFICPESTCNTTTDFLLPFYNGAFRLSADTGVPLIPMTFVGAARVWPRRGGLITPGTIIIYIHPPIPSSAFAGERLATGKAEVQALMTADLLRHYPAGHY